VTLRLYYQNSFLREFDAQVLSVEPAPAPSGCAPDAQQWHVVLDRTVFYPTSGGQPHDTGKLADASVLDVFERHDHGVVHVTGRVFEIGAVHGVIDWERRFDHMQQHTVQHLAGHEARG
jgi:alanyl-tRNA synthetase